MEFLRCIFQLGDGPSIGNYYSKLENKDSYFRMCPFNDVLLYLPVDVSLAHDLFPHFPCGLINLLEVTRGII